MFSQEVGRIIEEELGRGLEARAALNEGRARVCARRAAGAAVREYFRLIGAPGEGSAYDLLGVLAGMGAVPARAKVAAVYLLAKVDVDHNLTVDADLLAQARTLAQELEQLV